MRKIARNHTRKIAAIRESHPVIRFAKTGFDISTMEAMHNELVWTVYDGEKRMRVLDMEDGTFALAMLAENGTVQSVMFTLHANEDAPAAAPEADDIPSEALAPATDDDDWPGYKLDREQLAATREKVAKINDRAARKGLDGRLTVSVTEGTEIVNRAGFEVEETFYLVKITGDAPKMPEWEFAATLDWDPNAGLIVRTVPGGAPVNRDQLEEARCAHCSTNVLRYKTYVLRNKRTREEIQVGSTCIKDFLGWSASVATLEKGSEGFFGGEFEYTPEFSPKDVIKVAWASIQAFGWVPKSQYWKRATVADVEDVLYPPTKGEAARKAKELAEKLAPYVAEADARAKEIIAFILSDDFGGDSEYVLNLKSLVSGTYVSPRYLGMVASAPAAWARHREQEIIRKAKEEKNGKSVHVGTVKAREEFTVTVESIRYFDGDYGTRYLVMMRDENGNVLKWWASTDTAEAYEGKSVRIKATVKAHEEYRGVAATVLSRVAFLD